jgi:hypothetical protein
VLSGGQRLEDIELRRQDEVYLDALGAQRIPDPTTAGDFCRRFDRLDIESLQSAINESRLRVWQQQPREFFDEAVIEADGTLVPTQGECKEGADFSYKGQWGYHVLVVSLANTQEPLFLDNRGGNRPSSEGAAVRFDQALTLCRRAGLDGVRFVFGFDAHPKLIERAETLKKSAWMPLVRPPKYEVQTLPRGRRANVKEAKVIEREFENIRLDSEHVAEFAYSPKHCRKTYRMIVLRKNLTVSKGEQRLFDDVRYFFYLTNDTAAPAWQICASNVDAGGQSTQQLGVHGDGGAGLVAEGLVCTAAARGRPLGRSTSAREAGSTEDGIPLLPQRIHAASSPACPSRSSNDLPSTRLESLAGCLSTGRGSAPRTPTQLTHRRYRDREARIPRTTEAKRGRPRTVRQTQTQDRATNSADRKHRAEVCQSNSSLGYPIRRFPDALV